MASSEAQRNTPSICTHYRVLAPFSETFGANERQPIPRGKRDSKASKKAKGMKSCSPRSVLGTPSSIDFICSASVPRYDVTSQTASDKPQLQVWVVQGSLLVHMKRPHGLQRSGARDRARVMFDGVQVQQIQLHTDLEQAPAKGLTLHGSRSAEEAVAISVGEVLVCSPWRLEAPRHVRGSLRFASPRFAYTSSVLLREAELNPAASGIIQSTTSFVTRAGSVWVQLVTLDYKEHAGKCYSTVFINVSSSRGERMNAVFVPTRKCQFLTSQQLFTSLLGCHGNAPGAPIQ